MLVEKLKDVKMIDEMENGPKKKIYKLCHAHDQTINQILFINFATNLKQANNFFYFFSNCLSIYLPFISSYGVPWRLPSPDCIAVFGAADPLAVIEGRKEGRKPRSCRRVQGIEPIVSGMCVCVYVFQAL
jgi:hypothetical protein